MKSIKNFRRTIFFLFASVFLFPIYALSYQGFDIQVLDSEESDADGFIVVGYNGQDEIVTVPKEIGGIPVIEIGDRAFSENRLASFVIIPEGVEKIGLRAFYNCANLEIVKIPESVTEIGQNAFEHSEKLKKITLPSKLKTIEENLFANCYSLSEVKLPEELEKIKERAFAHCENLVDITLPSSVSEIGQGVFMDCPKINVKVSALNENLRAIQQGKGLISKDGKKLVAYFGTKSYLIVADNFTKIGAFAFYENKSLRKIEFPRTIKNIEKDAFKGCENLKDVVVENISAWNKIDFENQYANPLMYSENFYLNGEVVKALAFGESITEIKNYAYAGCKSLVGVSFEKNLASIGEGAFADCKNLAYIKNLSSGIKVGNDAFKNVPVFGQMQKDFKDGDLKNRFENQNETEPEEFHESVVEYDENELDSPYDMSKKSEAADSDFDSAELIFEEE